MVLKGVPRKRIRTTEVGRRGKRGVRQSGSVVTRTFVEPQLVLESLSGGSLERSVAEFMLGTQKLPRNQFPSHENIAAALKVPRSEVIEAAQRVRKVQYGSVLSQFPPGSDARRIAEMLLGAAGNPFRLPTNMTALSLELGTTIERIKEIRAEIDRIIYSRSRKNE